MSAWCAAQRALAGARARDRTDKGITLVELLVYMVLLSIVLVTVGGLFIQSLRVQQSVVSTGQANNNAQVTFAGIERAVRNASVNGVRTGEGGNLLVVHTGGGEATETWTCKAWFYVAPTAGRTSGTLYASTTPETPVSVTAADFATGAAPGWSMAIESVTPQGTQPMFAGDASTGVVVSMVARRASTAADLDAVTLTTTITPRPQGVTSSGECF